MNQEQMNKMLALAKEMGIEAEYKHAPEGADIDTWDMLKKSAAKYDKEGNPHQTPVSYTHLTLPTILRV